MEGLVITDKAGRNLPSGAIRSGKCRGGTKHYGRGETGVEAENQLRSNVASCPCCESQSFVGSLTVHDHGSGFGATIACEGCSSSLGFCVLEESHVTKGDAHRIAMDRISGCEFLIPSVVEPTAQAVELS